MKRKNAKYEMNEQFFDFIDSEEKAYFLGYLYADGSVSFNGYQACLALAEIDKSILEKFKEIINYTGPLLFTNRTKQQNQWRLLLNSKYLCESLAKKNCTTRKTKTIQFPNKEQVPEILYKHLIRGIFDGDGWSYHNKKNNDTKAGIVSASKPFLDSIKNITDQLEIKSSIGNYKTYYVLTYSGNNNSYKFLHWIYDDAKIYLERKKEKFLTSEFFVDQNVDRQPHRRAVEQLDNSGNLIKEFESAVHAERELNIRYQNIRVCCKFPKKTAGGYRWRWKC